MPDDALPWDRLFNAAALTPDPAKPVLIIGSGLAGCWTARTLAQAGVHVVVVEAGASPACGASSNPAGIVKPFVTRSPCLAMSFYLEAHAYLLQRLRDWHLDAACGFHGCGVVQLVENEYPPSAHYQCIDTDELQHALGMDAHGHAIAFTDSGWLNPLALCRALLQHELISLVCNKRVVCLKKAAAKYNAAHTVVTTGSALSAFEETQSLFITPARGQISRFKNRSGKVTLKQVVSGKHYVIPDGDTVLVGATFERGVDDDAVHVRATTPDRLPLVGPAPDIEQCKRTYHDLHHGRAIDNYPALPVHEGLSVLGGLGSRGIVTAPFAAHLLCDHLLGGGAINLWVPLINPARFTIRQLKKGID